MSKRADLVSGEKLVSVDVDGVGIDIVFKRVKRVTISIREGKVGVVAPIGIGLNRVEEIILTKLAWIKRHLSKAESVQILERKFESGEFVLLLGERLDCVVEVGGRNLVKLCNPILDSGAILGSGSIAGSGAILGSGSIAGSGAILDSDSILQCRELDGLGLSIGKSIVKMSYKKSADIEAKRRALNEFYRGVLSEIISCRIGIWENRTGIICPQWKIKLLKSVWGTCNTKTGAILFNLRLAKKPIECIDYIILHELSHMVSRLHDAKFKSFLDAHMPNWREIKKKLNEKNSDYKPN